jgi:hypothetical protein
MFSTDFLKYSPSGHSIVEIDKKRKVFWALKKEN